MPDIAQLIQSSGNGWTYLPIAVLLGALHGLEPGHSKTMMAAYIVAIRGTIGQAVLLGVCSALSHSLIVWIVAMLGLSLGREIADEGNHEQRPEIFDPGKSQGHLFVCDGQKDQRQDDREDPQCERHDERRAVQPSVVRQASVVSGPRNQRHYSPSGKALCL